MKSLRKNFNYIAVAAGIVFVWRGLWGLIDLFLFPKNEIISFVVSIFIGIVILLLINPKEMDIEELA